MKLKKLVTGLKSGAIKIDASKHYVSHVVESFTQHSKHTYEMIKKYKGKIDGTIPLEGNEINKDQRLMLNFYKRHIDIKIGAYNTMNSGTDLTCHDCGERMVPILINDNTIQMVGFKSYFELQDKYGLDFILTPDQVPQCEMYATRKKGYLKATIDVPTGDVVFGNTFISDLLEDERENKYGKGCVSYTFGRNDLMQHMSMKNVGYGQTSNLDVAIFVNTDGTEVIISDRQGYDSKNDEEYTIKFKGFKKYGDFHCSVWRWLCADLKILNEAKVVLPKNLKVGKPAELNYRPYVMTKLKPGKWEIKHYFDFMLNEISFHNHEEDIPMGRNPIYSHLKLMK